MNTTVKYNVNLGDLEVALSERDLCKDELLKEENSLLGGEKLKNDINDLSTSDVDKSLHINIKSHGIYVQFDRKLVKEGKKEWTFMVRDSIWGGGDITPQQWLKLSELGNKYSRYDDGSPSLRLTTRQTIQFHRVKKENVVSLVHSLIDLGRPTLNGCGDNVRNPTASILKSEIFDANALAQKLGEYFQLPLDEHFKVFGYEGKINQTQKRFKYVRKGLPRKLKIGIAGYLINEDGTGIYDNSTDILTNDIGIAPVIKENKLSGYQVYIGGGLGQKNRKVTFPLSGGAFGIFATEAELITGLDAIVQVQQQVGDRKNRIWARLKNVLIKKGLENSDYNIEEVILNHEIRNKVRDIGIEWYRTQVEKLGVSIKQPIDIDLPRFEHQTGWFKQPDGLWSYGLYIENGRLTDTSVQGPVKSVVDRIVKSTNPIIRITPAQNLLFLNLNEVAKTKLETILTEEDITTPSALRVSSIACVGLNTCSLAVSPSETFFNPLISELENRGYGNIDGISIGISGCERHCPRNVSYDISLEGKADNIYQIKFLLKEKGNYIAQDVIFDGQKYLRSVPKENVLDLLELIIKNYVDNKLDNENSISEFHSRIGIEGIINLISGNDKLKELLNKTSDPYTT